MPCDSVGNVLAGKTEAGASQSEIHILQVGLECLIEHTALVEQFRTEQRRSPWSGRDLAAGIPLRCVRHAVARSPWHASTAYQVEGSFNAVRIGCAEQLSRSKPGLRGREPLEVIRRERDVAVEHR